MGFMTVPPLSHILSVENYFQLTLLHAFLHMVVID